MQVLVPIQFDVNSAAAAFPWLRGTRCHHSLLKTYIFVFKLGLRPTERSWVSLFSRSGPTLSLLTGELGPRVRHVTVGTDEDLGRGTNCFYRRLFPSPSASPAFN